LPQFVNRGQVIASLPSLALVLLAALTPEDVEVEYIEVYELKPGQAGLYLTGHRLFYFRIGDYYAVLPELNPPVPVRGYGTLFIFRVPASQGGRDDAVGRILQFLGMRDSRDLKFLGAPLW